MKKIATLFALLAFLLCCTACGEAENEFGISMQDIVDANHTEKLLEHYGSFKIIVSDGVEPFEYYVDRQLVYEGFPDYQAITTEDSYYYTEQGGYYRTLYAGVEMDHAWYAQLPLDEESCLAEEILELQQEGDVIYLKTKLPQERFEDFFSAAEREKLESLAVEYELDAETNCIRTFTQIAMFTDGEMARQIVTVDQGAYRPDIAENLYMRLSQTDEIRTVTVVLDPLTEEERSYSVTVPKGGDEVIPYCSQEYSGGMYLDPECSIPFAGEVDYENDMTFYIPRVERE
ncbi:MAG: hypothetical protein IJP07_03960 [Firmicutes bacterium]|nr:hypothetical protein [Bacillota bacterium]